MKRFRSMLLMTVAALCPSLVAATDSHAQTRGGNGGVAKGTTGGIASAGGGGGGAERAEPFSMEVVSRWGGPVNDVEVVGNIAYIGSGSRFVVLDVTDPANITEIGSLDLIVPVMSIDVQGQWAHVTTATEAAPTCPGPYGFCRVNITNPALPILDSFDLDVPGQVEWQQVAVYNSTAYVTHSNSAEIFDLAPAQINWTGSLSDLIGFAPEWLHVEGNLLYVTGSWPNPALQIYDLAPNPMQPALLSEVDFPSPGHFTPRSMDVFNGVAAVTAHVVLSEPVITERETVLFFDVSNPSQPLLKSVYDQFGQVPADSPTFQLYIPVVTGVALAGDHALVTQYADISGSAEPPIWQAAKGVVVLNIKDLMNPFEVTNIKTHGTTRDVRVFGNRAFVMDDGEGLLIYDLSNIASPQRVGHYHSPAHVRHMVKNGNRLYVADKWDGFAILDVSNPLATPFVIGRYQTPMASVGSNQNTRIDHVAIAYLSNRVYLMTYEFGIHVVDVSSPATPQLIEEIPNPVIAIPGASPVPTRGCTEIVNGSVLHATYRPRCSLQSSGPACNRWYFATYDLGEPNGSTTPLLGLSHMEANVTPTAPTDLAVHTPGVVIGAKADHGVTIDSGWPTFSSASVLAANEPSNCLGVDVAGSTLLLANAATTTPQGGLYTQSIVSPFNISPQQLGQVNFNTPGVKLRRAWDVTAQNNRAYVFGNARPNPSCSNHSANCVLAFDIQNPASPMLLGFAIVSSEAVSSILPERGVLIADEPFVYAAGGRTGDTIPRHDGLSIIRINGLPTDCPADINGDNTVNVTDLLAVISAWGPCTAPPPACAADINDDNQVNVTDLLAVISNWGPCD